MDIESADESRIAEAVSACERADTILLCLGEAADMSGEAAVKLGLEGIVSKRREQPYRSGPNSGWVKVKTAAWREANRDRWEMFLDKRRGGASS